MYLKIFTVFLMGLFLLGCTQSVPTANPTPTLTIAPTLLPTIPVTSPKVNVTANKVNVFYYTSSLFSWSTSSTSILDDGTVEITYSKMNRTTNKWEVESNQTGKLSKEEINSFKKLVVDSNVFNLKDTYDCDNTVESNGCGGMDGSASISFSINEKEKNISLTDYPTKYPSSLTKILDEIRKISEEVKQQNTFD